MGSFYVHYVAKSFDRPAIEMALEGRHAFASAVHNGYVIVVDEESDSQQETVIAALVEKLSRATHGPVLSVLNHDDDILWLLLYSDGHKLDEYNSAPSYFDTFGDPSDPPRGGDASLLCRTFGSSRVTEVEAVLRADMDRYVLASERHAELASALRIPGHRIGYKMLGAHTLDDALGKTDLVAALERDRHTVGPVGVRGTPVAPPRLVNGVQLAVPPDPTQYRATFTRSDGHRQRRAVDGDWLRLEDFEGGRVTRVQIERPDRDAAYVHDLRAGSSSVGRLRPLLAVRKSFEAHTPAQRWQPVRAEVVGGRPATLFEGYVEGLLARRSWRDNATGLELRMETVDRAGRTALRVDTTDIEIGPPPDRVFEPEWLESAATR